MSDEMIRAAELRGDAVKRAPLNYVILDEVAPFGPALGQDRHWPAAILPAQSGMRLYALLDAARQPFLVDLLQSSDEQHRCLFKGDTAAKLADVAPWLVQLDPLGKFSRNLFTQSDAPFHLWDRAPGVLIRSNAAFDQLWRWCRKLLWVNDEHGKRFLLRWWDPTCFQITMPILQALDTRIRKRDFEVEIIAPAAWTVKS